MSSNITQRLRANRATLFQVAEIAQVSKSTVSRVVNEDESVSEETRKRVLEAISLTGYRVNQSARALASNRTGAIAVAIYEQLATYFTSAFSGAMVTALQDYFFEKNIQMLILPAPESKRQKRIEKFIYDGHVDGAILLGPVSEDILLPDLLANQIPLVIGGRPAGSEKVSYVDIDNVGASAKVTKQLILAGAKKIGFITGQLNNLSATDRLVGYQRALQGAGIESHETLVAMGDWSYESAVAGTQKILDSNPDVDAIFCSNDLMATAAMAVLRERGISVPGQVWVVGFDNSPTALRTSPQLTSVSQDPESYARALGESLLAQMDSEKSEAGPIILSTEIIWRDSFPKPKTNKENNEISD